MNILAIGAHADDVELGCGASLVKWASEGHNVTIFVVTNSEYSAPNGETVREAAAAQTEATKSAELIGAKLLFGNFEAMDLQPSDALNIEFLKVLDTVQPDIVLTHWSGDTHPDHRTVSQTSVHVSRNVHSVLGYASNWYLGPQTFDGRMSVDVTNTLETKISLIEIFESENTRTQGKWVKYAKNQAAVHGQRINAQYAENFEVIKYLIA